MSALMPNRFGVYANTPQGINAQAMQMQTTPQLNAAGNYGTDPLTGAPITDRFVAGNMLDPRSGNAERIASYMQGTPAMMPTRPTGGGGGGRMGPPRPRNKIMRVGPRTASEYTAEQGSLTPQRQSTLDTAYQSGNLTSGFKPAQQAPTMLSNGATPMEQSGGYNVPLSAFDKPQEKVQPMAKGGTMTPNKIYKFGEEGVELGVPTGDGNMHVIPHGATKKLLPMLENVTPRARGGMMEMRTPQATFAGGETPYGPVYGMRQTEAQMGSPMPMTMQEAGLAMQPDERMIADGRYQVDLAALRAGGAETMPMRPDVVSGPFAEPAMPADTSGLNRFVGGQVSRLTAAGAAPVSKYPGMTFQDNAPQARYDNAMRLGQNDKAALAYSEQDPFNGASLNTSFEELRDRVALRGMMYGDEFRDRQNRDRVQLDLAARNARAPLGTPTMLPGQGSEARIAANLARERERLSRTPQGAMFLAEQQQQRDIIADRMKAAGTAVPVRDPATGEVMGYVNGLGASLPSRVQPGERQLTPAEAEALGLVPMSVEGQTVRYGRPTEDQGDWQITQIDGPMVSDPVFPDKMIPGPRQTVRVNKRTGEYQPLKPAQAKAEAAKADKAGTDGGQDFATYYASIPKGGTYTHPDGSQRIKK